jgi:hypothetical protein
MCKHKDSSKISLLHNQNQHTSMQLAYYHFALPIARDVTHGADILSGGTEMSTGTS